MVKMSYVYSAFLTFACTLSYAQNVTTTLNMHVIASSEWYLHSSACLLAAVGFPFGLVGQGLETEWH